MRFRGAAWAAISFLAVFLAGAARGDGALRYICPMHAEVQRPAPGVCPRCGMALVAVGVDRSQASYALELTTEPPWPAVPSARRPVSLRLRVRAPDGADVHAFAVVHEHPLHLFLLSHDLDWFAHVHPTLEPNGAFTLTQRFPSPGPYQVIADFVPEGGAPQWIRRLLLVGPGGADKPLHAAKLPRRDVTRHVADGITAVLSSERRVATRTTSVQIGYRAARGTVGLEPYLGADVHVLVVSEDLADVMHVHGDRIPPGPGDPEERVRFDVCFPRAATYRLWAQVGRAGGVHTDVFTVTVEPMARAD